MITIQPSGVIYFVSFKGLWSVVLYLISWAYPPSFDTGKRVLSDAWALDTAQKPYRWQKLNPEGDKPSARM
jgi:hypothetical protein